MKTAGDVLIIDDNPDFLQMYQDRLGEEGYSVGTARDPQSAVAKLDEGAWDVVLVDRRLPGKDGLDLLPEVARRAPFAKIILVTAFPSDDSIARAFAEGVYDYLVKDSQFTPFLRAKLRNAVDAARSARLNSFSAETTEATLRETWEAVNREKDRNKKGKLLEDLMVLLFKTVPGFLQTTPRRKNRVEEIDILIQNESTDPFWAKEEAFILAECKNWSKPAGAPELAQLIAKIEGRFHRCRLGFFIAPGGFTGPFKEALLAERKGKTLVLLIDGPALAQLVMAADRSAFLKDRYSRALVELNGAH